MVSRTIFNFLQSVIDHVVNGKDNINEITGEFIKEIENDPAKCKTFISKLENVKQFLRIDLSFFMDSDPAVDSEEETIQIQGFNGITLPCSASYLKFGLLLLASLFSSNE